MFHGSFVADVAIKARLRHFVRVRGAHPETRSNFVIARAVERSGLRRRVCRVSASPGCAAIILASHIACGLTDGYSINDAIRWSRLLGTYRSPKKPRMANTTTIAPMIQMMLYGIKQLLVHLKGTRLGRLLPSNMATCSSRGVLARGFDPTNHNVARGQRL